MGSINGNILTPYRDLEFKSNKLVYGWGINDSDYLVFTVENINGKQVNTWACPFYRKWCHVLERCHSEKFKEKQPTYTNCTMCIEWKYFSVFKAWMETQCWQGMFLDKDLLVRGNKLYSPDTCIFVSRVVNNFLTNRSNLRGEYPLGVNFSKSTGRIVARCCNPLSGKREFLGNYTTAEEAHKAWLTRKREIANLLAAEQTDHRVAEALIRYYDVEVFEE